MQCELFHKTENNDAQTNESSRRAGEVREETKSRAEQSCESAGETMAEKDCGVYAFRCLNDGRFYIGSSKKIKQRHGTHMRNAKNGSMNFFSKHLRKFGVSAFVFGVVEYCEESERLARERYWIEAFRAVSHGFNTQTDPTKGHNYQWSAETIHRMSEAQRNKTEEHRARISTALRGKKRSHEICLKMSLSAKKRNPPTLETRAKLSAALKLRKRKPHTREARAKISAAQKGKKKPPFSEQHKAQMSKSAKHRSEAHIANLRAALRGRKMPLRSSEAISKTAAKNRGRRRSEESRQRMREGIARAKAAKVAALIKGVIAAPVAEAEKVVDVPAEQA